MTGKAYQAGAYYLPNTIPGAAIQDYSLGNTKLGEAAVDSFRIQDGTIVGGDIAAQTIKGAEVGAGMHIGYRTIYGGQAGANSNIQPGSIQGGDLQAQTIRGGVDGAASRIVPASLNYLDLALGSACQTTQSPAFGQANTNGPWTWISGNAQVSLTTTGQPVLVIIVGSLTNNTAGTLAYIGHAQNSNTTANYTGNISTITAGAWYPYIIAAFYFPAAGSYTWYGVCGTSSGSLTMNGYMMAIEFRR